MADNGLGVPEDETFRREFFGGQWMVAHEAAGEAVEPAKMGTFTEPIRRLGRVENMAIPWYNFDSHQTNLSIRYFNNLKSIQQAQSGAGLGRVFKVRFHA
jgi:hypothetical protein